MSKADLLRNFLEQRGVRVPTRNTFMVSCINTDFHWRGDRRPSASVNMTKGRYHCFSCGLTGDVYDLCQHEFGVDFATAKRMLGTVQHTEEPTWI